ncbi:LysM peptidoglycan-binding domain-containing protein [Anaerocolumna xylanovorans]|uniref:LysM domain-containing protein n=1 Tax=Anaerocolumna xylanovorans DSM 12503 TaxID=1121345 RepID=A0A1M7YCJ2_9FIRM|nr:LysM peptidoglycan-binding domain-containing protein [Anaerocolumna xylanovorans]SHO50354.1 LysM domain-containing protein [Anaerocolumna xylanovorans DSM 12503]
MNFSEYRCMNYVIEQGDTLYSISRENNVPLPLILRLNPFVDIYNLQVGDEICIPVIVGASQNEVFEYVVEEGDSVQSVLDRFEITPEDLLKNNSLSQMMLLPGTRLNIPSEPE